MPGHTEAAAVTRRLRRMPPVGVICEIMSDDGTMARLPELRRFARRHGLRICSIEQLIQFRRASDRLVEHCGDHLNADRMNSPVLYRSD